MNNQATEQGFTLLEVLIALTITGLALGSLISLSISSKQLALKSSKVMSETMLLRAAVNEAQLQDGQDNVHSILTGADISVTANGLIDKPERQTKPVKYALQTYQVRWQGKQIESVRWQLLDLPK